MTTTATARNDGGQTQAWLMLAQATAERGDTKAANAWLDKIDNPQRALEVQTRRAMLLARQGKVLEARTLVQQVPERRPEDARAKLLAESQVLRDVKRWTDAHAVLVSANQRFPDDADLLYEQAMMAEKLSRIDEMERLLRRVIEIKPDHHHAYNALGYSLADRSQRLPEAQSLIKKALELAPGDPFITDSLGWVEYPPGQPRRGRCGCCAWPTRRGPTRRSPRTWAKCCGSAARATMRAESGAKAASAMPPTRCCARR